MNTSPPTKETNKQKTKKKCKKQNGECSYAQKELNSTAFENVPSSNVVDDINLCCSYLYPFYF